MTIKVIARGQSEAEVLIHEPIGEGLFGGGISSKRFAEDLGKLEGVRTIKVRINSPGGYVDDGIAIYNTLRGHGARVKVVVEGLAASMASAIAMAGDEIHFAEGAQMMIHRPWGGAIGDADAMRKAGAVLDKYEDALIGIYAKRTGLARGEIKEMLAVETWMNGAEAVEKGFADTADSADAEIAAALYQDQRVSFAAYAQKVRQNTAKLNPLQFAAAIKSASADASTTEKGNMPETAPASVQNTDNIMNVATEAARAAVAAESERRRRIRERFGKFAEAHRDLLDSCLEDTNCTPDAAAAKLLEVIGKDVEPLARPVEVTADSVDKFLAGAEKGILAKLGYEKREAGNEFVGMSLPDIAARALSIRGISVRGFTRNQIASKVFAAQTTSDFPQLMSNVAGKVLRAAYGNFPNTWNVWAAAGSVSDFKVHPRIQLGSFDGLATIPEGGEYTYGSLKEDYENASAVTKGKAIALTRQMIVNDDLGAFNRRASLMGRAAARSVNTDAYTYLTSGSGNNGPTTSDGVQYFNASHSNLTGTGTAMTVDSLGVGRAAMRKQKDKGGKETLNIEPAVLLCSVAKEDVARTLMASETDPSQSNSRKPNIYQNRFTVVSDPYLDTVSTTAWYLFANPADVAAFEVVFLDGVQEPFVDEMIDFDTDSMKFKVRLDYGVAPGDWRAGYRNVGA